MAAEDIVKHSVHTLVFRSLKRTHDMFLHNHTFPVARDNKSDELKIQCKIRDEYSAVKNLPVPKDVSAVNQDQHDISALQQGAGKFDQPPVILGAHPYPAAPGIPLSDQTQAVTREPSQAGIQQVLKALPPSRAQVEAGKQTPGIRDIQRQAMKSGGQERLAGPQSSKALVQSDASKLSSNAIVQKRAQTMPKPEWHAPWKLMRVISGHTGWVRSVAVEPANSWFATGSADRTIKIWDLASGKLKLSLTGHISTVRGLVVSTRHPYLFSCGEDKTVKCWDLEHNKVIRSYHGHLSAVHDISLHPTIDVLLTCGRDSTARVWDVRTKACIHTLAGHTNTVAVVRTQAAEPQVVTGSHDCTVRLWDLAAAKTKATLTNHKKSIRAMTLHPTQYAFASASPDNVKQWKFPDGNFLQNLQGHNSIINCMTVNSDNVLVTGGDNGTMYFWDWKTGYNFQRFQATAQPGSLDSEAGVFAMTFDQSQSRLITCEADKTVKIYKEDETATEESHPISWRPEIVKRKRY